jgi:deazaflavin-dependent oxidoreductase (nitroreductase family)
MAENKDRQTYLRDRHEYNRRIIEEFRANGGKVSGGPFAGSLLLLLTTRGAKSGQLRTIPLGYLSYNDRFVIFGTKGGDPTHPDWYYNLLAHPQATITVGTETFEVTATVAPSGLRDQLFATKAKTAPIFNDYQSKTTRIIPAVILERLPV